MTVEALTWCCLGWGKWGEDLARAELSRRHQNVRFKPMHALLVMIILLMKRKSPISRVKR